MNYIKTFESYNNDDATTLEHFDKIIDMLKHRGFSLNDIKVDNNMIIYGDTKTISLDKNGNVKMNNGNRSTIIGSIQINPSVNIDGELLGFHGTDYKYTDGSDIELGDDVIVDDDFMASVDGFSDGEVLVVDGDDDTHYVSPSQIKKDDK